MARNNYKKYMKNNVTKDYTLLKLFVVSFLGMLLIFTFLIKSFTPSVDVSIGNYKQESEIDNSDAMKKIVDGRLAMIQDEDQGKDFSDLMTKSEKFSKEELSKESEIKFDSDEKKDSVNNVVNNQVVQKDPVYKVFIGSYTSAEQAKVAKDIILETGINLNPMVKCIGSNNYSLQVGIFKNKTGAEALLTTIIQNHLPGRIIEEN